MRNSRKTKQQQTLRFVNSQTKNPRVWSKCGWVFVNYEVEEMVGSLVVGRMPVSKLESGYQGHLSLLHHQYLHQ